MSGEESRTERVFFYGTGDTGTYLQIETAFNIAESFNKEKPLSNISDYIELHNVHKYLKEGILSKYYSETQVKELSSQINSVVARFFQEINNTNVVMLKSCFQRLEK